MKKTAKLLALVLALVMVMGSFPVAAFAGSVINKVEIFDVALPVIGEKASDHIEMPDLDVRDYQLVSENAEKAFWLETNVQVTSSNIRNLLENFDPFDGKTFTEGKYYTFCVSVTAKSGSSWASGSNLTATINGQSASISAAYENTNYRLVLKCYGPLKYGSQTTVGLNKVEITGVKVPVIGEKASDNRTLPANATYKTANISFDFMFENYNPVYHFMWVESDKPITSLSPYVQEENVIIDLGPGLGRMTPCKVVSSDYAFEGRFKEGKYYACIINIVPTNGRVWAGIYDVTATINGLPANVSKYNYSTSLQYYNNNMGMYTVWKSFGPLTPIDVTEVTVTPPCVGEKPNFTPTAYESDKYQAACSWVETDTKPAVPLDAVQNEKLQGKILDINSTFKADKYYTAVCVLTPKETANALYSFHDSSLAWINGSINVGELVYVDEKPTFLFANTFGTLKDMNVCLNGYQAQWNSVTGADEYHFTVYKDGKKTAAYINGNSLKTNIENVVKLKGTGDYYITVEAYDSAKKIIGFDKSETVRLIAKNPPTDITVQGLEIGGNTWSEANGLKRGRESCNATVTFNRAIPEGYYAKVTGYLKENGTSVYKFSASADKKTFLSDTLLGFSCIGTCTFDFDFEIYDADTNKVVHRGTKSFGNIRITGGTVISEVKLFTEALVTGTASAPAITCASNANFGVSSYSAVPPYGRINYISGQWKIKGEPISETNLVHMNSMPLVEVELRAKQGYCFSKNTKVEIENAQIKETVSLDGGTRMYVRILGNVVHIHEYVWEPFNWQYHEKGCSSCRGTFAREDHTFPDTWKTVSGDSNKEYRECTVCGYKQTKYKSGVITSFDTYMPLNDNIPAGITVKGALEYRVLRDSELEKMELVKVEYFVKGSSSPMKETDVFELGKQYVQRVTVRAKDSYRFATTIGSDGLRTSYYTIQSVSSDGKTMVMESYYKPEKRMATVTFETNYAPGGKFTPPTVTTEPAGLEPTNYGISIYLPDYTLEWEKSTNAWTALTPGYIGTKLPDLTEDMLIIPNNVPDAKILLYAIYDTSANYNPTHIIIKNRGKVEDETFKGGMSNMGLHETNYSFLSDELFTASVKIDTPIPSGKPAENATVPNNADYTVESISWAGNPLVFAGETSYTATISLKTKNGKTFAESAQAYVNGQEATAVLNASRTAMTVTYKVTPTATWDIIFDGNGGLAELSHKETGSNAKLESLPGATRTDWIFNGWFTEAEGGTEITTSTVFTEDTTVYAHWTQRTAKVNVINGTASKTAAARGDTVTITANPAPEGKVFDRWVVKDGDITVIFLVRASTDFTMGEKDVTLEATYKDAPIAEYFITVDNGTASLEEAAAGTVITVTADPAPEGAVFDKWVVNSGNITLANEKSATTTFTLGESNVSLEATYKEAPAVMYGDVDGNGILQAADARLCLRASVGLEVYAANSVQAIACDVDGNGTIQAADARLILRKSVGLETSFPVENS